MRARDVGARAAVLALLAAPGCWSSAGYPTLERTRIDYANHGRYFPIAAGTAHSRPDCEWCHGGMPTFLAFTCIRCHDHARAHTDSLHAGIAGYAFDSTSCYGCHPNGTAAGVDHTQFFLIGPGTKHATQHCIDCHPSPQNRRAFDCIDCHDHRAAVSDPAHAGVPGYSFASPACLGCHTKGEVMTREQHAVLFPILTGPHALACSDCHVTSGGFASFECILCHDHTCDLMNPRHAEVRDYACTSAACYRCHPSGRAGG